MAEQTEAAPIRLDPASIDAVVFDMDGVATDTAAAHAQAWKAVFDDLLARRAQAGGAPFVPFDADRDYRAHVDGKPRFDGVRDFLASRDITLPEGSADDPEDADTVRAIGMRKNRAFLDWLAANRAQVMEDGAALIAALDRAGIACAVISSSRNAEAVLKSAGLADAFGARVDGAEAERLGLPGKPDPAIFIEAARRVGAAPGRAAVVEDAPVGVAAGRAGGFARVIGVDRGPEAEGESAQARALAEAGADTVLRDLRAVAPGPARISSLPSGRVLRREIAARLAGGAAAAFLDFDGTLAAIVEDPDAAGLTPEMRAAVGALAEAMPVAVVSGRGLDDVAGRIGVDGLYFAGSHGYEMAGPGDWRETVAEAKDFLPALDKVEAGLRDALSDIDGAAVERKPFALAIHYRRAAKADAPRVAEAVRAAVAAAPDLVCAEGRKVFDIRPGIDWHKGRAVLRLLEKLGLGAEARAFHLGDDVTDEDAFRSLSESGRGFGVAVRGAADRESAAAYAIDPEEVRRFLEDIAAAIKEARR